VNLFHSSQETQRRREGRLALPRKKSPCAAWDNRPNRAAICNRGNQRRCMILRNEIGKGGVALLVWQKKQPLRIAGFALRERAKGGGEGLRFSSGEERAQKWGEKKMGR